MPSNEQQPHSPEADIDPMFDSLNQQSDSVDLGNRQKTLAVRVEEDLHTQLRFIANITGSSVTAEIRHAIQAHINSARDDPDFKERAEHARQQIEREAAARAAAIAGFLGAPAVAASTTDASPPKSTTRGRRPAKAGAHESILGERS